MYSSLVYILQSCASISPPQGGFKDTKPPKILSTYPKQNQKGFKDKRITIYFNEKIDVSKLKDKIIISPVIDNDYEVEARNKTVILQFRKPIATPNDTIGKTYTVDFTNGLKDINEGNTIEEFKLVFSTGSKLDSGSVNGLIRDCYTKDSVQSALVGLYINSDTLDIQKHKPTYYAYSNKGLFTITNIKNAPYRIIAFNDKNKNLLVDTKLEKLGFLSEPITVQNIDTNSISLELSKNDLQVPKLLSNRNDATYNMIFDEGLYTYQIDSELKLYHALSPNRKEIILYKTDLCEDSIPIKLTVTDSAYNDTTYLVKILQNSPKKFTRYKDIIKSIEPTSGTTFQDTITLKITTLEPILYETDSSITINADSTSIKIIRLNKDFNKNNSNTSYTYTYKPKFPIKKFIEFTIGSNKFRTILGDTNSKYTAKYTPAKPVDDSELNKAGVLINTKERSFYVELLNEKMDILNKQTNNKSIVYKDLQPGKYSIRIVADNNSDGKWDSGKYNINLQPEKVKIYKKVLDVKKNWDIEDLVLNF